MNRTVMLAAFVLGAAMTHQAVACDFSREANNAPAVVADCQNGNCATETPTTTEPTTAASKTATAKPAAQEPLDSAQPQPAAVTVAQQP